MEDLGEQVEFAADGVPLSLDMTPEPVSRHRSIDIFARIEGDAQVLARAFEVALGVPRFAQAVGGVFEPVRIAIQFVFTARTVELTVIQRPAQGDLEFIGPAFEIGDYANNPRAAIIIVPAWPATVVRLTALSDQREGQG